MAFENAIPLNRTAYARSPAVDPSSNGSAPHRHEGMGSGRKQSVNVSAETMLKVARAKLHRMVDSRRGYNQEGALAGESTVGSLLSTKA